MTRFVQGIIQMENDDAGEATKYGADDLRAAFSKFSEKHNFEPGDVVQWKPGMKIKKTDGPFIITEVLAEPILDDCDDAGSVYFRERLDVKAGNIVGNGEFVEFHYDSRRFERFPDEPVASA